MNRRAAYRKGLEDGMRITSSMVMHFHLRWYSKPPSGVRNVEKGSGGVANQCSWWQKRVKQPSALPASVAWDPITSCTPEGGNGAERQWRRYVQQAPEEGNEVPTFGRSDKW